MNKDDQLWRTLTRSTNDEFENQIFQDVKIVTRDAFVLKKSETLRFMN